MTTFPINKLAKLTIMAFTTAKRNTPVPGLSYFEAQYNPESLTLKHENLQQDEKGVGGNGGVARSFMGTLSRQLSVNLVLDGTQVDHFDFEAVGALPTVSMQIQRFLQICYNVQSTTHEPAYLRLLWGSGVLGYDFDCSLKSVDVKYTAFNRDGSPLHADLTAQFMETPDPLKVAAEKRISSPDLTHRRKILAGDTLPFLCKEIYGSANYYIRVAEFNGLDDFRRLVPGQDLYFPPLTQERQG